MTEKDLIQYRSLKLEEMELADELKEFTTTDKCIYSSVINNYNSGFPVPEVIRGVNWGKYERLCKTLDKVERKIKSIEEFVEAIPDSPTRQAFRLYYTKGREKQTWQMVASKMGYKNESSPRKDLHDKYFNAPITPEKPCYNKE